MLNEFTGASTRTLKIRLKNMLVDLDEIRASDGHGGSPLEGILERIGDLEAELKRRAQLEATQERVG